MLRIKFLLENKEIQVEQGENLLDGARKAGIVIDAPCNGNLSCGKCKVKIVSGKVDSASSHHISHEELEKGYVLACNTRIIEDIVVEVPTEASAFMHGMKIDDLSSERDQEIFERAKRQVLDHGMTFKSYVQKEYIEIDVPTLDDNISDWDRIKRYLRNHLGYTQVFCRLQMLRKIPGILRGSDFKVTITHIPRGKGRTTIVNMEVGDTTNRLYGIAVDIGTTSVAACLVDLYNGSLLAKASMGNAQIKYGADVINRIIFAAKGDGLQKLNDAIIYETINPLIRKMLNSAKVDKDEVIAFVAAGNTTMAHLLLGVYPDYLRREPYIPAFLRAPFIKASELEIEVNPETFLYIVPSVASYVGGDITAGVLSSGIWSVEENVLFIDLGTNGEIVFGNKDFLMTCACSAGPAFEGGEISCGMRATDGAIDRISIDRETYESQFKVIGDKKPLGICGSGIIDLISEMMICGIMDRRGKLNRDLHISRIRVDEHGIGEYILAFKEAYGMEKDLTINEVDIDNFIRAKGAIYSGASVLLSSLGMDFTMIDRVYIAGGIGNSLNIQNSIRIGMLPDIEENKFMYIGNSSLMGAYLTLMSEDGRHKLEDIANQMTYVELSVHPNYMDEFVSACFLPHTDIEMFPNVKKLLEE
ncbi:uncharacterized 2Fe-2S/4Fe-4S cluster protein (DUF4445 family) [Anaerosolibacter carboniphilus]|uniref:Uncharacterized 2Fe-2S/4Fe-4S cluster protein (DUF4445 family) n=1 Tax=Anaerosolibacter carboniphilus TaxID=1417629 RepID=A0A841KP05_9FIRM|nr:corrinoid activation/regeneration protein AcsV [Anaerosolibacter carboniphilus]MBB6215167.1 uncharacterized 2Fe-2S/4Fe-4S cluster protein (DUF4445 family) [Anaerosolibacter carboniphilus]